MKYIFNVNCNFVVNSEGKNVIKYSKIYGDEMVSTFFSQELASS